jgi:Immunoglobulin-like domain of bacterial spore germination
MKRAAASASTVVALLVCAGCIGDGDDSAATTSGGDTSADPGALPAISVDSPAAGATVSSPLRVRGSANTFEATLELEVRSDEGEKLAAAVVTATCGTGCRGTFDEELGFDPGDAEAITLVAFERSARDGSRINVVRVPLEVR